MAGRTITRADLSDAVCHEVGLSRVDAAELVESVLEEVSDALARGETVKISSFGSFSVREKGERWGRNPKTGEPARIDPRRKNGGGFLGLNGTVVKSHGAADATGVAAAVELAYDLAQSGFGARLAERIATAAGAAEDGAAESGLEQKKDGTDP